MMKKRIFKKMTNLIESNGYTLDDNFMLDENHPLDDFEIDILNHIDNNNVKVSSGTNSGTMNANYFKVTAFYDDDTLFAVIILEDDSTKREVLIPERNEINNEDNFLKV